MIIIRFAHCTSVGICLYALLILLLFPFNTFAQRDYGSSPRGFGFDTQLCYRECDKAANTKAELPCCRELCTWKSCVSNAQDPGAEKTECQPHYQIYTNCLDKNRAAKKSPAPNPLQGPVWRSGFMEQQSRKGNKYTGELLQISGSQDTWAATWNAFDHKNNKLDGNWPVTISFSNSTVTILEHHSKQKWVGSCSGSQDRPTITCNGKETTKGDFTFTITLSK